MSTKNKGNSNVKAKTGSAGKKKNKITQMVKLIKKAKII